MKFHTTKKEITNGFNHVICVPYCDLEQLLQYESPSAYTTRTEGWGADIYIFGGVAIATGYAPFGNIRPSYEINKKYDDMATKMFPEYFNDLETDLAYQKMINNYIEEVTAQ